MNTVSVLIKINVFCAMHVKLHARYITVLSPDAPGVRSGYYGMGNILMLPA